MVFDGLTYEQAIERKLMSNPTKHSKFTGYSTPVSLVKGHNVPAHILKAHKEANTNHKAKDNDPGYQAQRAAQQISDKALFGASPGVKSTNFHPQFESGMQKVNTLRTQAASKASLASQRALQNAARRRAQKKSMLRKVR
jgi:hypothetical protein